jgi:hypothetical protein
MSEMQELEPERQKTELQNVGLEYANQVQIETVNLDALKMPDDVDDVFQSTQNDENNFFCGSQNAEIDVFTSTQIEAGDGQLVNHVNYI